MFGCPPVKKGTKQIVISLKRMYLSIQTLYRKGHGHNEGLHISATYSDGFNLDDRSW